MGGGAFKVVMVRSIRSSFQITSSSPLRLLLSHISSWMMCYRLLMQIIVLTRFSERIMRKEFVVAKLFVIQLNDPIY